MTACLWVHVYILLLNTQFLFALKIIEELRLEETSQGHLAQPPAPTISRQLLHIPKDGESAATLAGYANVHLPSSREPKPIS